MAFVLELHNIGKQYKNKFIFNHIDLKLSKGEIIGIKGSSGAGKSTLLKMAAQVVPPTVGKIIIRAKKTGYVFQEPRLIPWNTALENVALPLVAMGEYKKNAQKKALKFLDKMELSGFEKHYPGELSGGMKQRVSIARALAVQPDLLLLDEPFTGLDFFLRDTIRTLLETALEKSAVTVIHVTHDEKELIRQTHTLYSLSPQSLLRDHFFEGCEKNMG